METKNWYQSKGLWLAILQGAAGVFLVLSGLHPELGYIAIAKSIVDGLVRLMTTQPIG